MTETIEPVTTTDTVLDEDAQRELAAQMVDQARTAGIDLVGRGGLLTGLTKQVRGPARSARWRTVEDVEPATLDWVQWHNTARLRGYLGDVPTAELENEF